MNPNFGIICHTEVYLTLSRLAAKLSEMITKFQSCSLKIQHQDQPKHCFTVLTKPNKSMKVLFPEPKPNRTEHVKSA